MDSNINTDKVKVAEGKIKETLTPTRLPSTLEVTASWSGGRPATFQHQETDWKLQWLKIISMWPAVMIGITLSPRSCVGILPPSPGSMPAILLWRDFAMQLLQSHLLSLNQNVRQCFWNNFWEKYVKLWHFDIYYDVLFTVILQAKRTVANSSPSAVDYNKNVQIFYFIVEI